MKMNKRKLFVAALAVCLIAILSMSTLAWFSASDSVLNEFMVATSTDTDADDIFSIDVWETVDPENDGTTKDVGVGDSTEGTTASYTDILPGDKLTKVAHVKNTGYYDQFVRVTVEISDASVWAAALGTTDFNDETLEAFFGGFNKAAWTNITTEVDGDTIRVVMYYAGTLTGDHGTDDAGADIVVFSTVNVPEALTQEQAASLTGGFTVKVSAEAVQTENMGATAYEAFAKLDAEANA